jgi:hypothetical protein
MAEHVAEDEYAALPRRQRLKHGGDSEPHSVCGEGGAFRVGVIPPARGGRHQPWNVERRHEGRSDVDAGVAEVER